MSMIIIAIPSYKRPSSLTKLLKAIAVASFPMPVRIVVADNDPDLQEAMHVVGNLVPDYPFPLEALLVRARGISAARNALVNHAMSIRKMCWIVMIDDDEWPEPDWVGRLHSAAIFSKADIVGGSVHPVFKVAVARHIQEHPFFWHKADSLCEFVDRTSNLMLSRRVFEGISPPWFDDHFGLSGGGDHDFLLRAKSAGFVFANVPASIVYEEVPASRSTAKWLLRRAWRKGNSNAEMAIKHDGFWQALLADLPKIIGGSVLGILIFALFVFSPRIRLSGACRLARAMGKTMSFLRVRYYEYTTVHGS